MTLRCALKASGNFNCLSFKIVCVTRVIGFRRAQSCTLVFWPEENSVTVLSSTKVTTSQENGLQVGDDCTVMFGKSPYNGKVAALGRCFYSKEFSKTASFSF